LAYQDEFFVNNTLDVKENDEHDLDFAVFQRGTVAFVSGSKA
jgi:hypothetical protein